MERNLRKTRVGTVVSDKMDKTRVSGTRLLKVAVVKLVFTCTAMEERVLIV